MGSPLHIMRTLSRRLGGGLALLFLWSSLVAASAPPAPATSPLLEPPLELHAMEHHAAGHHAAHHTLPPPPAPHHHGDGGCCLAGQHCSSACNLSLVAAPAYGEVAALRLSPASHSPTQALTRPPQPPRRPPKL